MFLQELHRNRLIIIAQPQVTSDAYDGISSATIERLCHIYELTIMSNDVA